MPQAILSAVRPEDVETVWPLAGPMIQMGIGERMVTHTLDDVLFDLIDSYKTLWLLFEDKEVVGAAVTDVEITPRLRVAVLRWAGGNGIKSGVKPSLKAFAEWARLNDCDLIRIDGRKGWSRLVEAEVIGQMALLHTDEVLSREQ